MGSFKEKNKKITTESFVESATHFENIIITCGKHGDFLQSPSNHLSGHGCRKCQNIISKPETKWLDELNIKIRNKTIRINSKNYNVDGLDVDTNTIFEFYGSYYHGDLTRFNRNDINPTIGKTYGYLYDKTIERENVFNGAGYKVVSIWESDYNNAKKMRKVRNRKK
jgi:hypothetical protein